MAVAVMQPGQCGPIDKTEVVAHPVLGDVGDRRGVNVESDQKHAGPEAGRAPEPGPPPDVRLESRKPDQGREKGKGLR